MPSPPLIVFDVNETLLDLETMVPIFERIFGEELAMRLWFRTSSCIPRRLRLPIVMCPSRISALR